jgi:hypothetical protein
MRVGFTGTREGMTDLQRDALSAWLTRQGRVCEFHHGAALGADEQAVRALLTLAESFEHIRAAAIHAHPADVPQQGSAAAFILSHKRHKVRKPLSRNADILDACDVLIAAPKGKREELRSGTWATIRGARKLGRRLVIIWPDGTIREEAARVLKAA